MSIDLAQHDRLITEATLAFWGNRTLAAKVQEEAGNLDQGSRGAVTAGKNMDGFLILLRNLVVANGLPESTIHVKRRVTTLPGYFRPTKQWDLLVVHHDRLVAAVELKSQVGSLGNNFNNRTEEAIGSAHDFRTAHREGAFGADVPKPFLGWLMMVGDSPKARAAVSFAEPHFPVDDAFRGCSYAARYNLLCRRLVEEQLYDAACLLLSPPAAVESGKTESMDTLTSAHEFCVSFAGRIATEAAR